MQVYFAGMFVYVRTQNNWIQHDQYTISLAEQRQVIVSGSCFFTGPSGDLMYRSATNPLLLYLAVVSVRVLYVLHIVAECCKRSSLAHYTSIADK